MDTVHRGGVAFLGKNVKYFYSFTNLTHSNFPMQRIARAQRSLRGYKACS